LFITENLLFIICFAVGTGTEKWMTQETQAQDLGTDHSIANGISVGKHLESLPTIVAAVPTRTNKLTPVVAKPFTSILPKQSIHIPSQASSRIIKINICDLKTKQNPAIITSGHVQHKIIKLKNINSPRVNFENINNNVNDANNEFSNNKVHEILLNKKGTKSPKNEEKLLRLKGGEKTYSAEDLATAVNLVINGHEKPVSVIARFQIPKRTIFRHLNSKRVALGIIHPSIKNKKSSSTNVAPKHLVEENKAGQENNIHPTTITRLRKQ
jgi:hypothetical protein